MSGKIGLLPLGKSEVIEVNWSWIQTKKPEPFFWADICVQLWTISYLTEVSKWTFLWYQPNCLCYHLHVALSSSSLRLSCSDVFWHVVQPDNTCINNNFPSISSSWNSKILALLVILRLLLLKAKPPPHHWRKPAAKKQISSCPTITDFPVSCLSAFTGYAASSVYRTLMSAFHSLSLRSFALLSTIF